MFGKLLKDLCHGSIQIIFLDQMADGSQVFVRLSIPLMNILRVSGETYQNFVNVVMTPNYQDRIYKI